MALKFTKLSQFDTIYGADSVEWCPVEGFEEVFVCGTYKLDAQSAVAGMPQQRIGRLFLFRLEDEESWKTLRPVQTLDTPGILDTKWAHRPVNGRVLLGVADARGCVVVYQLKQEEFYRLEELCKYDSSGGEEVVSLSLDWSTGRNSESENVQLLMSDSLGRITLLQLTESTLKATLVISAHMFSAWIAAFDYWDTNVFCSGGDDAKMNVYDMRKSPGGEPVLSNSTHSSGVTTMHSNSHKQYSFITGSYDEEVRHWDTRSLRRPVSSLEVGGGVWRLKWEPLENESDTAGQKIIAACMHDGFAALHVSGQEEIKVLARYKEHHSLAYGIDWSKLAYSKIPPSLLPQEQTENEGRIVAACSYYDRKLSLALLSQ